ncbi:hypothetical protein SLS55_010443 [Diplodia seriata]|uniref:Uncharacterized protein n=1 Tax=Diplodia seriata TaxID=420778 RepID=A0ABR3C1P4_9PEZI
MFISQSHRTTGMRLAGIADLSAERATAALQRTGFPADKYDATGTLSVAAGLLAGKTAITTDAAELIATPGIDVVLEITGNPAAGIKHALLVCPTRTHHLPSSDHQLTRRAKSAASMGNTSSW